MRHPKGTVMESAEQAAYLFDEGCAESLPGNKIMLHQLHEGLQGVSQDLPRTAGTEQGTR